MFLLRFLAPLALILSLVAYILLPWANQVFLNWSIADLQMRSKLVFSSIQDDLPDVLSTERTSILTKRFTQLANDERLIGIAYCENSGAPKFSNKDFPSDIVCPPAASLEKEDFKQKFIKGGPVMVAIFPVVVSASPDNAAKAGNLIIVHDMAFAERRNAQAEHYILWFIFGVSVLASLITMTVARLTLSRWVLGLRDFVRTGKLVRGLPREAAIGLTREIQQRIRQIEREHQRPLFSGPRWSASALFEFVRTHLPSEQLITVSCRQPYAHRETAKGITWSTPASGLVTAIEPIMKACKGIWIAVATSEADKKTADENGVIAVPPDNPSYNLKRLWLTESEDAGFYAGFSNEGIWPLCIMAYVKPFFRAEDWEMYKVVNQKFADAIVASVKSPSPIIFIQDYHFGLLPRLIREKLPNSLIILFWHIPWPNSETFGILPWRDAFLDGMLAADIVGFHTQFHCNNFLDCVDTHVEALIDHEHNTVQRGNDFCMVRPYPISIAWPDFDEMKVPDGNACREWCNKLLNLRSSAKIILGVERLDYAKGIPERLRAYRIMLEQHPELLNKVCFVQIASPSRSIIPAYADLGYEVEQLATDINAKFGSKAWQPVHLLKENFGQSDVYRFYRSADVCIVSSLHDGMNLVAKEFIAAREDERGVLVLSQFAGSSRELIDAIIVNPYDQAGLAESFIRALSMNEDEQTARMRNMREQVKTHNVFAWAAEILGDAANLHRRRQLNALLKQTKPEPSEINITQM